MSASSNVKTLSLDARLGLDKYEIDEQQSHIQIDAARCTTCERKPCLTCCPAYVYRWVDDHVAVRYENCLECGTCRVAAPEYVKWHYPRGGFGVQYRLG